MTYSPTFVVAPLLDIVDVGLVFGHLVDVPAGVLAMAGISNLCLLLSGGGLNLSRLSFKKALLVAEWLV